MAVVPTPRGLRRVPLWNSAIEHARAAAATLAGSSAPSSAPLPYFWTDQFGLALKAVGHAPFIGDPTVVEHDPEAERWLLTWPGAAVAVNVRMPIPKLRALAQG